MFIEYTSGGTFLHHLDVRTKGLGFLFVIISAFLFSNPAFNFVILILCLILGSAIRMPFQHFYNMFKPLIPILVLIIIFASISYHPDSFTNAYSRQILFSIFSDNYLVCTMGGILFGISLSLRIITMVIASTLFTMTTPIDEILYILKKMRVSYKFGFIFTTGLRFIPTMEKKAHQIIDAQRSRGSKFHKGNIIQKIRAYIPVMIPMIVESLRMSENLAMAMLNRGFGATKNWTILDELKPRWIDYILSVLLALCLSGTIYIRMLGFGKL